MPGRPNIVALRGVSPRYAWLPGSSRTGVRLDLDQRARTGPRDQHLVEQLRRDDERVASSNLRARPQESALEPEPLLLEPDGRGFELAEPGSGPPPPGVVRRRTALPGSSRGNASGPEARIVLDELVERHAALTACRTSPPTSVCASRNGVPCSTRCSARSVAAFTGLLAAAVIRSSTKSAVAMSPASAASDSAQVSSASNKRLLVLLQVAVVRERQALEGREQTGEVADQSPALPRASSAMSGFFFCGSIDDPVA